MTQSVQSHAAAERHSRGDVLVPIGDVVAKLQHTYPEVSHSSLRFLEREGLIEPRRTAGGHRLYTPADIERIAQIKTWQAQRLSLVEIRERLAARSDLTEPASLASRFLEAVLAGIPDASAVVLEADDLGMPLIQIFEDVLRPALRDVGQRWAHGELRVGQEHEVTEVARDLIAELTARHAQWEGTDRPILAACVAGEHHDLGLRMVIALLRARGQGVQYLGADVSARFLVEEVAARGCDIVLLSATMDARLPAIKATVEALRAVDSIPPRTILIGGEAARRQRDDIAALGVTPIIDDDFEGTLQTILSARDERVRHDLQG